MTEIEPPVLRTILRGDLEALHALSAEAGWPHRVEDLSLVWSFGRGVVACDGAGLIGGCAMWWAFGKTAGSVGVVVVSPVLRGRGLGRRLMRAIIEEAEPRRLLLNATEAGRRLYETEGFATTGRIAQHQGFVSCVPAPDGRVRVMTDADLSAILALDAAASGCDRGRMLDALLASGTCSVAEANGVVVGFAITRRFGRGHVVGPLVAPDDLTATALMQRSLAAHAGEFLRIDTPAASPFAAFLDQAGLIEVDQALTMTRGAPPVWAAQAWIYALAAQALG